MRNFSRRCYFLAVDNAHISLKYTGRNCSVNQKHAINPKERKKTRAPFSYIRSLCSKASFGVALVAKASK